MKPMSYKGYVAKVEYDDDSGTFYGRVENINDIIDFHGSSVEELKQSFADSIECYIEFCIENNEEPEKPFSGKFMVRTNSGIHRTAALNARKLNISLNKYVEDAISFYSSVKVFSGKVTPKQPMLHSSIPDVTYSAMGGESKPFARLH